MAVMDTPYRSGDIRHGYQAVADNLPNDPRIHAETGTKKIFFKQYGTIPAQLQAALSKTGSVPIDIDPITSFGDDVR